MPPRTRRHRRATALSGHPEPGAEINPLRLGPRDLFGAALAHQTQGRAGSGCATRSRASADSRARCSASTRRQPRRTSRLCADEPRHGAAASLVEEVAQPRLGGPLRVSSWPAAGRARSTLARTASGFGVRREAGTSRTTATRLALDAGDTAKDEAVSELLHAAPVGPPALPVTSDEYA